MANRLKARLKIIQNDETHPRKTNGSYFSYIAS